MTFVVALSANFTFASLGFILMSFSCATLEESIDAVAPLSKYNFNLIPPMVSSAHNKRLSSFSDVRTFSILSIYSDLSIVCPHSTIHCHMALFVALIALQF